MASKNASLEKNAEEIKYILMSRHHGAAEDYKIANRSFENVI
jgi:hypothetical protein